MMMMMMICLFSLLDWLKLTLPVVYRVAWGSICDWTVYSNTKAPLPSHCRGTPSLWRSLQSHVTNFGIEVFFLVAHFRKWFGLLHVKIVHFNQHCALKVHPSWKSQGDGRHFGVPESLHWLICTLPGHHILRPGETAIKPPHEHRRLACYVMKSSWIWYLRVVLLSFFELWLVSFECRWNEKRREVFFSFRHCRPIVYIGEGVGLSVYYFRGSESSEMLLTETPGICKERRTWMISHQGLLEMNMPLCLSDLFFFARVGSVDFRALRGSAARPLIGTKLHQCWPLQLHLLRWLGPIKAMSATMTCSCKCKTANTRRWSLQMSMLMMMTSHALINLLGVSHGFVGPTQLPAPRPVTSAVRWTALRRQSWGSAGLKRLPASFPKSWKSGRASIPTSQRCRKSCETFVRMAPWKLHQSQIQVTQNPPIPRCLRWPRHATKTRGTVLPIWWKL